ncbi:MAG: ETC complex I subunit [Alphaproteobacteria bacterium]|nr:ETC complex I subunit [Alphaproteobacteria bacterium]MBU0799336.1 ETC complex I subunit [Alphaproteobacteria bacterium]MBU0887956.1 ETC complex I subunit [Alphaproteobacteria bacterium]MBU1814821.1 ETC complex I subunit [Alphaproteobacteria bacterium]MBU2090876.1 ETC complex I subunit [Alphaproteobacteria bacterium]
MLARIYQPSKNAMQSGRAGTRRWVLEYAPVTARRPEPLMGWVSSGDTMNQVKLRFDSKEEAIAYARKHALQFVVEEPKLRAPIKPKAYADNFAFSRLTPWTH